MSFSFLFVDVVSFDVSAIHLTMKDFHFTLFYFSFIISLWKTFFLFIVRVIRKSFSASFRSAGRFSQQVICNSFWRQFSTKSLSLFDSSTIFYRLITLFAHYSTILIDVRWKFWSLKFSDFSEFESAILFIHFSESTTSSRFKTSWFNFVLISNAFATRTFFEIFWSNLQL